MSISKGLKYFKELVKDIEDYEFREVGDLIILKTSRKEPYDEQELYTHFYENKGEINYGWYSSFNYKDETDCYYRPIEKWEMLFAASYPVKDQIDKLIDVYKKHYPECKKLTYDESLLRKNNFADRQKYVLIDYLKEKELSFEDFIFDPSYVVIVSTNNSFRKMIWSGILDTESIIDFADEYYFRNGESYD